MRAPACLALLLLSACSFPIMATIPAEEQALRRPENRAGILVDGELVRATWLPDVVGSQVLAADPSSFPGFATAFDRWLVSSRVVNGRAQLAYSGHPAKWRHGLLRSQDDLWPALAAARDRSPFHAPVQASMGEEKVWAVGDLVPVGMLRPGGEALATVEFYQSDPRTGQGERPASLWVVARRDATGVEVKRDLGQFPLMARPGGFFRASKLERSAEGQLTGLEFARWKPDTAAAMGGQVAADVLGGGNPYELMMERQLTDALLEWKTRQLPAWLAAASLEMLEQAIITAEKGMMQLDLKSRLVKDEIDAAARQGAGSQPQLTEKAQLLDQRKTLIVAVLGTFKTARAQVR